MQHRLGGADDDDDIGVGNSRCDAEAYSVVLAEIDEIRVFDVVHPHATVERPCECGRKHVIELPAAGPSRKPGSDEDRLLLVGHAEVPQFLDRGADGRASGIDGRARHRQRGHVGDDRRPRPTGNQSMERWPGQREAEGVPYSGTDVCDRLRWRRGWCQHDRVVGRVDDEQPGAREERDAHPSTH